MTQTRKIYRDAGTGRIVSKQYAVENPGTTVSDTVQVPDHVAEDQLPEEPVVNPLDADC